MKKVLITGSKGFIGKNLKLYLTQFKDIQVTCFDKNDFGTKEILDSILVDTEESVDWLETQFNRIKDIGIQNYLTESMNADGN